MLKINSPEAHVVSMIVTLSRSHAGHCQDSPHNSGPSTNRNPGSNTFPNGLNPNCRSRMQRQAEPSGWTLIWSTPPEHRTVMGSPGFTDSNPARRFSQIHGSRNRRSASNACVCRSPWDGNWLRAEVNYTSVENGTLTSRASGPHLSRFPRRPISRRSDRRMALRFGVNLLQEMI